MRVGESFKKGFSVASGSFPLVLLLVLISVVFGLLTRPLTSSLQPVLQKMQGQSPDFAELLPMLPSILLVALVSILLNIFTNAGSIVFIGDTIKQGKGNFASFFTTGAKFYLRFILLFFVTMLFMLGVFLLVVLSAIIGGAIMALGKNSGPMAVVGAVVMFLLIAAVLVGTFYYFVRLFVLAPYIIVLKDTQAMTAIKESREFTKKNFWPFFGLMLLFILIALVAGLIFSVMTSMTGLGAPTATGVAGGVGQIVMAIVTGFVFNYLGVAIKGAYMSFYLGRSSGV